MCSLQHRNCGGFVSAVGRDNLWGVEAVSSGKEPAGRHPALAKLPVYLGTMTMRSRELVPVTNMPQNESCLTIAPAPLRIILRLNIKGKNVIKGVHLEGLRIIGGPAKLASQYYGRGNLFSLSLALKHVGVEHEVSSEPGVVRSASILILPGVGAFADAVTGLKYRGLFEPVRHHAMDDKPFLGIGVGCQLLMSIGEEFGVTGGFNILPGNVRRISNLLPAETNGPMRIPNVGWRGVTPEYNGTDGIWSANSHEDLMYYFVHSLVPNPEIAEHVHARSDFNGITIPVALKKGNVLGVQFHPERSGDAGLNLLESVIGGWR